MSIVAKYGWNASPDGPGPGPGPNPPGNTYTVPTSIDATGGTDVTSALTAFFGDVPDGVLGAMSFIVFQPGAIYRCESAITLTDRQYLDIFFNLGQLLRTIVGTIRTNYNLSITSSLTGASIGCNLYGGSIIGANPATTLANNAYKSAWEAQHCVNISGNVQNLTIGGQNGAVGTQGDYTNPATRMVMTNSYGDSVYFGAGLPPSTFPTNIRVTGSKLLLAGRQATSPVAGSTVRVDHCLIGNAVRHCYDAEPDGALWVMDGLELDHNDVLECGLGYLAGNGAGTVNNVNVHDDNLTGMAPGIVVSNRHPGTRLNWAISNVTTDSPAHGTPAPGGLFNLTNVDGFTATNIDVTLAAGRGDYAAQLTGCTDFSFPGCSFPNAVATYIERPFIDTCTPAGAPASGGTTLTITGRLLDTISGIDINGIPATSFVATDAGHATCVTPVAVPGAHNTTATIPADKSGVAQPATAHFGDQYMRLASVVVTSGATTYTLNTDYTYAYHAGIDAYEITRVIGGALAVGTAVTINYTQYDNVTVNPVDTWGDAPNGFNFQYTPVD